MKTEKLLYKLYMKIKKSVMNITLDNLTISLNVLSPPVSKLKVFGNYSVSKI